MIPQCSLRRALEDPNLLDMGQPSWIAWRSLLLAVMGEQLQPQELDYFRLFTGRTDAPSKRADEAWFVVGRRGGKTRAMAAVACYIAALCQHSHHLARGQRGYVLIVAPDLKQAGELVSYCRGIFEAPLLRQLVMRETAEEIELNNSVTIRVQTPNYRRIRGFTAVAVILDEVAFWMHEDSSQPDIEVLNAVRPCLATTGGPLVAISSPHARKGILWEAFNRDYGPNGDPQILVAKGATLEFNLDRKPDGTLKLQAWVDRRYERDPAAAAAECGAEFRTDLEQFVSQEVLEACTDQDRERAYDGNYRYTAFVDPSGGSTDSMTLAIAHIEQNIIVVDLVREVTAPFSPMQVVEEFSSLLKSYKISTVYGDRYAGEWPPEQFSRNGILYEPSEWNKSELYLSFLPMLNSRTVALLNNDRLQRQLLSLERRSGRGGRDIIDHPRGGRDDLANAVAGVCVMVRQVPGASSPVNFNRQIDMSRWGAVA
jgi:hypothetical protein